MAREIVPVGVTPHDRNQWYRHNTTSSQNSGLVYLPAERRTTHLISSCLSVRRLPIVTSLARSPAAKIWSIIISRRLTVQIVSRTRDHVTLSCWTDSSALHLLRTSSHLTAYIMRPSNIRSHYALIGLRPSVRPSACPVSCVTQPLCSSQQFLSRHSTSNQECKNNLGWFLIVKSS